MSQLHRVGKPTPQMFDCHFLPNEVKYIHNGCPLLEEDHVRAANLPTENVWILVRIKEAIPNTQARAAFMSMFILEIDQNRKRQISVQHYQIPTRVVYYHLEDHTKAITSFIRQDLYHMKITYQPPNITHSERQNYEVEFQAIASAFMSSSPIMVHFSTRSAKTDAPRVAWNMGIPVSTFLKRDVFHGLIYYHHLEGEIFQDSFDFILSDCQEPPNLSEIYDVAKLIFTDSMKSYKQDPAIPMLTSSFRTPEIFTNHLTTEEGASFFISGENLMVSDLDTRDDDLRIQLKKCPQYGHIELHGLIQEGDMFTLEDLQSYKVRYQHDDSETLEDIVIFSATDGFNTADGVLRVQRGEIGHSPCVAILTLIVSYGEATSCCFNRAVLPPLPLHTSLPVYDLNITVLPINNQCPTIHLGCMFTVDEGSSACISLDYLNASDKDTIPEELTFFLETNPQYGYLEDTLPSPGYEKSNAGNNISVSIKSWNIHIKDDVLEENHEVLKIILSMPQNAVPEQKNELTVEIIDSRADGVMSRKCPPGWSPQDKHCYLLTPVRNAIWESAERACRKCSQGFEEPFTGHLSAGFQLLLASCKKKSQAWKKELDDFLLDQLVSHGHLASVHSPKEMSWLWKFANKQPFWIGLPEKGEKDQWVWSNGQPVTFHNFKEGKPSQNQTVQLRCVLVQKKEKWRINMFPNAIVSDVFSDQTWDGSSEDLIWFLIWLFQGRDQEQKKCVLKFMKGQYPQAVATNRSVVYNE
ncbi:unnamed protein product [Lepidochelys olivacea]